VVSQSVENIPILFGNNTKAQLAARTVFGLAHRHSDILHDGWKNILDCMLQLFRAKLLAEVLVMVCPVVFGDFSMLLIIMAVIITRTVFNML